MTSKAVNIGHRLALIYKRFKAVALRFDHFFVAKALQQKLPVWIGHIPLIVLSIVLLTFLFFSLLITLGIFFVILVFGFIAERNNSNSNMENNEDNALFGKDDDSYRSYGHPNALDDGAPYGESYGTCYDED